MMNSKLLAQDKTSGIAEGPSGVGLCCRRVSGGMAIEFFLTSTICKMINNTAL